MGADTYITRCGLIYPSELYITVCEHASSSEIAFKFNSEWHYAARENGHVLGVRPSQRQPFLAPHFLTTENHARTSAVPLDNSDLNFVLARDQSRALRIA
jgi:hypothetical protein